MKRNEYYSQQHQKNLQSFIELGKRIATEELQIMDIRVDKEQFGHARVVIFLHEPKEEKDGSQEE